MRALVRAVFTAMSSFGLIAASSVSAPSFAAEGERAPASASAMLAAVTAPMLVTETAPKPADDFSTTGTAPDSGAAKPASLADAVTHRLAAEPADDEHECLAVSVYFESKGEPLQGQLAVAQTILNRVESGRFADTICGVVRQPGQFSFVRRGGGLPSINHDNAAWREAVAVAAVARAGLWKSVAPAALYFHARRLSPGWGRTQVASLGNHIFYR